MEPGNVLFDRYRVVRRIAAGGMGTVFEALDLVLDQPVALKQVRYAALPEADAEDTRARTLREARTAARLRGNPHVVAIYDVQVADGDVWLVLEYVPSRSLAEVTAGHVRLDVRTAAGIGAAVARGLAAAHAGGVTHRDVKPGNILIATADGTAKLTDFGISRAEGESTLTMTGEVSGTPAYMAREVARGEDATPASDVFSLAATLYAAVEGTGPFGPQSNPRAMVYRVANDPVRPPQVCGPLEPVLRAMLADEPDRRPDAATVARWLDDLAGRPAEPSGHPGPPAPVRGPGGPQQSPPAAPRTPPGPGRVPAGTGVPAPQARAGAGVAPPPGPVRPDPGPPGPDGSVPVGARRRGPLLLAGAVALVAVLAVGAFAVFGSGTSGPDGPAAAPVSPRAVSGDPRLADPCPLLDQAVLGGFGAATPAVASTLSGCHTDVVPPGGQVVRVSAYFTGRPDVPGAPRQVGDLTQVRGGPASDPGGRGRACSHTVGLPDGNAVRFDVESFDPAVAPCTVADRVLDAATARLQRDGVTYDPARNPASGLAGADACGALDEAALVRAGVETRAFPGFANWSCSWGTAQIYVTLVFGATTTERGVVGSPVAPIAGRDAFSRPDGGGCAVTVLRGPAAGGRVELVTTTVALAGAPRERMCAAAADLASTAQGRLPAG
ncbi:serine/threonine-protein kinase [Pseudonocardia sp. KRD291]|uniref:serine/threonine-protein kinase n=1 Tax=Pseudonocardia sp. KRD291 TaxID=2792007 RepID=UPI001C4A5CB0|nr:serine/threonine-protein kinase [Pseudonocardia sp. KRD291]MBW0104899.1 protein kinase [Pseudonocardia sp. KRD291]